MTAQVSQQERDGEKTMGTTRDLKHRMEMVANLLSRADGLGDTPEADLMRSKAEEWMRDYRIAEEEVIASQRESGHVDIRPEWSTVQVTRVASEFREEYSSLWRYVVAHVGIRAGSFYSPDFTEIIGEACGYEGDLRYAFWIFNNAKLVFQERIEPTVDSSLSDQENCYRLRSAGIPRNRVAFLLWGASMDSDGAAAHGKVAKLYKQACAERGEDAALNGRTINAKTYRAVYAREFVQALWQRMRRAQENSGGREVEFVGRIDRINEEFYSRYPAYRPISTDVEKAEPEAPKPCERCAKNASGHCRKHPALAWTKAEDEQWRRTHESPTALRARDAGRQAAQDVEIRGAANSPAKLDDSGNGTDQLQVGSV